MTEKYGVVAVDDWQQSLEDPAFTGAVIATPAPLHVPMAFRALDRGRHALIEKPLAIDQSGTGQLSRWRTP
jgi:predicted dehydrogenase